MLKLNHQDITLSKFAADKTEAITNIAAALTEKSLVEAGYIDGMLNRENQNSTFLGNGIAIPHGTVETRSMVKSTGVAVHHYPKGVDWGNGNIAYVVIGIAAKSDEHLGILKQLTKVLSADGVEQRLRNVASVPELLALLGGEIQFEADFDASLIQRDFPASDMVQMSAVAAGLLKNSGCAGSEFVADLVTKQPTHLGQGLWLVGSDKQVMRTGVSFVSTANDCEYEGNKVLGLVAVAACNNAHQSILNNLTNLVIDQKQTALLQANTEQVLAMLSGAVIEPELNGQDANSAVFKIKNAHGLHARPGAMLVAEAKKYESNIRVANIDGDGKFVNAKSLMKVIALGVKHGHQLKFTADGADAQQAIDALGQAIEAGLGEG